MVLASLSTWMQAAPGRAQPVLLDQLPLVQTIPGDATSYLYRMHWPALKQQLTGRPALAAIEEPEVQLFFAEIDRTGRREPTLAPMYDFLMSALHQDLVMIGRSHDAETSENRASPKPEARTVRKPARRVASRPAAPSASQQEEAEEKEAEEESEGNAEKVRAAKAERPPSVSENVAIVTAAPDRLGEFRKQYDAMLKTVEEWAEKPETARMGPLDFTILGAADTGAHVAWKQNQFIWATDRKSAEWTSRFGSPGAGVTAPLARSEMFGRTVGPLLAGMKTPPVALYYYDLRPAWKRFREMPGATAWNGLSWRSIQGMGGAAFVTEDGYLNRHYWTVDKDHRVGLFVHSPDSRVNDDWLKHVPARATGFTTGVWSPSSFVLSLMGLAGKLFGQSEAMVQGGAGAGMVLQPMLGQIGSRYLMYRVPGDYGAFPIANMLPLADMVVICELKDREAFLNNLEAVIKMIPTGSPPAVDVDGTRFVTINIMYFSIHMAVLENHIVITGNPQVAKDAVENWKKPGPAIVDTEPYRAVRRYRLPDACFEMYISPGGFSRGVYDQYIPMLQQTVAVSDAASRMMGDNKGGFIPGLNYLLFPRGSAIARHAKAPTFVSGRDDGTGVLFEAHAPVLCTPYYWAYVHALVHLNPAGADGVWGILKFFGTPIKATSEEK
jgi:protein required for attachment to host cells